MGRSYFIWNDVDCRSKGIYLAGPVPIVRPEERIKHIEIPGRAGDLTQTEGENIFNSYIQTASIQVYGGFRVRDAYEWLHGSGYVTFSGEPDRKQEARIIGAITLNKHSRNIDVWEGEVQFYCQPLKERLRTGYEELTSGVVLKNLGDVTAFPLFRMHTGASACSITVTHEDNSSETLSFSDMPTDQTYIVDTQIYDVYARTDGKIVTQRTSGDFPVLKRGKNTVTWSGITTMNIDMRERFL